MSFLSGWWRRITRGREAGDLEHGLDEEVRFHIDQQIEKNMRQGMTPDDARRAAFVRFGGVEGSKEQVRDEFRPALLQDFARDMKIGARRLWRAKGFAVVAVMTIGLGTGAATAVFSVVNDVLLRPLPYPASDHLVLLYQLDKNGRKSRNVSGPNVDDWQTMTHSFAGIARMASWGPTPAASGEQSTMAVTGLVSKEFFDVIGVHPIIGRAFIDAEQKVGAPPVAIISRSLWRRAMESRTDLGATPLRIGGGMYTVVGVMPEGFDFPDGTGIWLPGESIAQSKSRTAHNYRVVARLRDGVSLESAIADISRVSRDMKARYGEDTWMSDATAASMLREMTASSAPTLRLLFGAAILLLVIATINVSSLLVARAAARRQEFAVQMAIGAGRGRLARQLLAETAVLCLAGSILGAVTATWAVRALVVIGPSNTPRLAGANVDWVALLFALGAATMTTIVLGLLTTLGARSTGIVSALADGARGTLGRRGLMVRRALVVAQVALTLVLLAGTGLLAQSFVRVLAVEPGFRVDNSLVLDVTLTDGGTDYRVVRTSQLDRITERLRALPGVTNVGVTTGFPFGGGNYPNGQFLEMTSADEFKSFADVAKLGPAARARTGFGSYRIVSGDYFATMGIPLFVGRVFEDTDSLNAPHVAVISRSLAESRWPTQDPIGRYIQYGNMDGDLRGLRIVGVVGDVREGSVEAPIAPTVYASYRQRPNSLWRTSIVVRGTRADTLGATVRTIVREVSPDLPVELRTVSQAFDNSLKTRRFSLILIGAFGGAAFLLAIGGLYALIAYIVAQRSREIGIRMALGATTGRLVSMVLRSGALLAVIGCAVGVAASIWLSRLVQGLLFNTAPTDPFVLTSVTAVTLVASIAASLLPARRATKVSPVRSLRGE
jgi:predicted permease